MLLYVLGIAILNWIELRATTYYQSDVEMQHGIPYVFTVRAVNRVHLMSELSSNYLSTDIVPPTGGIVTIGHSLHTASRWIKGDELLVSWYGFDDLDSAVVNYQIGVGRTSIDVDIMNYQSVGLDNYFLIPQNTLNHSGNYYAHVKAFDASGNQVEKVSDSFGVDETPPETITCKVWQNYVQLNISQVPSDTVNNTDIVFQLEFEKHIPTRIILKGKCLQTFPVVKVQKDWFDMFEKIVGVGKCSYTCVIILQESVLTNVTVYSPLKQSELVVDSCSSVDRIESENNPNPLIVTISKGFYLHTTIMMRDQESKIRHFELAVGTLKGANQLVDYINIGPRNTFASSELRIHHRMVLYVTVIATNNAGSNTSVVSEPVYVDETPPEMAEVKLMVIRKASASIQFQVDWTGTTDPESNVTACYWGIGEQHHYSYTYIYVLATVHLKNC